MTFEEWKAEAQKVAERLLDPEPIWGQGDPYSLLEVGRFSFNKGITPEAFIREIFADDIAEVAYHRHLIEESEIANAESRNDPE